MAAVKEQFVCRPDGERVGVLLDIKDYELLLAEAEELEAIRAYDAAKADNGPLRVLPGSHQSGRLTAAQIADCRAQIAEVVCPVPLGGALLMRPLLLHASSPALLPARRCVVHLEFAANALPGGLEWLRAQ